MPNWVTCPWPPHFLEILDYQWNEVAIPYWKEAAKFAEDHGVKVAFEWKDIISAFRLVGYDYVISIEHEDALMSTEEGLAKAVAALKEACIVEPLGEMFWA